MPNLGLDLYKQALFLQNSPVCPGPWSSDETRLFRGEPEGRSRLARLHHELLTKAQGPELHPAQGPELRPTLEPETFEINAEEHCGAASSAPPRAYDALTGHTVTTGRVCRAPSGSGTFLR